VRDCGGGVGNAMHAGMAIFFYRFCAFPANILRLVYPSLVFRSICTSTIEHAALSSDYRAICFTPAEGRISFLDL
jgi:hypothetical protein